MKVKVVYDQTLDEDEIMLYAHKDANNYLKIYYFPENTTKPSIILNHKISFVFG